METSKLEKIILPNRDGANLYLIQTESESKIYKLECDLEHKYTVEYACVTLEDDNQTIKAFDPAGGPYLYVGYRIDTERKIKAIIPFEDNMLFLIGT